MAMHGRAWERWRRPRRIPLGRVIEERMRRLADAVNGTAAGASVERSRRVDPALARLEDTRGRTAARYGPA
ncbi:MAG: hypothetical protein FJZ92_10380 [Chloroflexi bacterium]|nr:hypothetical protein [Chloroflexota bacterium]